MLSEQQSFDVVDLENYVILLYITEFFLYNYFSHFLVKEGWEIHEENAFSYIQPSAYKNFFFFSFNCNDI